MADPNYIKRIQVMRERNILSRTKGKPLIFRENQVIDLLMANKIPAQMQHCILKVFPKMQGSGHEKFISAVNICAAVFQKYGYMKPGVTTLTGKGLRNNMRHRLEVDAGRKKSQYDALKNGLWRGYLDRREKELQTKKRGEQASPMSNIGRQPSPATKTVLAAPPSTNVTQARGPVTSTAAPVPPGKAAPGKGEPAMPKGKLNPVNRLLKTFEDE
jgi:hypothetical protein